MHQCEIFCGKTACFESPSCWCTGRESNEFNSVPCISTLSSEKPESQKRNLFMVRFIDSLLINVRENPLHAGGTYRGYVLVTWESLRASHICRGGTCAVADWSRTCLQNIVCLHLVMCLLWRMNFLSSTKSHLKYSLMVGCWCVFAKVCFSSNPFRMRRRNLI